MENKETHQTHSSNPNRQTTLPENYSSYLPENHSGFLPEYHQPSYPVFDPSWLNPSTQLNPSYDFDSALLNEYFENLSLSMPRHQPESVLRSRAHAVAMGQNGNLYAGLYPQELGFTYDDDNLAYLNLINTQNGFTGRVNWSLFEPGPSPNQNGLFREHMYASNGLNGQTWPSPNQNSLLREYMYESNGLNGQTRPLYGNNPVNGSRFEPRPSSNRNGVLFDSLYRPNSRPNQGRTRPIQMDWAGPSSNRNGLFSDPVYTANGPSRNQNGLFSKSMCPSNRPNGFSSRPSPDRDQPVDHDLGRIGPTYTGRINRANGIGLEYANHNVKDFRGKIKLMAKNRDESAFLKKKIEDGVEEDFELIFEEVKDDVVGLMMNYFGNSVVQKLFKVCGPEQISYMLGLLIRAKHQFAEICRDNHGSLAMEKLLQNLRTREQRSSVISVLRGIVLNLSKDQNGLKVVQYCIVHFPENVDVLINEIADDCFGIATHKSGCVVLQDCLGRAVGETMERLMAELGPNVLLLSEHPYGNYVVQYLLEKKNPSITKIVLSWLAGNYVSLSMNKCSSNVVEKCLAVTREDEAAVIIVEIMNSDNFKMVIQDPYGNYVVQKALEVSQNMRQSEIHVRLENRIMSLYGSLNSHPFANRVLSKLNHRSKPH